MPTDDLVVRLQTTLDEIEKKADAEGHHDPDEGGYYACPATRSEPLGDLPWGEDACTCGLAKRRADVLRLVQAHRDILELHQGAHECREMHEGVYAPDWPADAPYGAPGEKWRHAATEYFEADTPCPSVLALARGYGLEVQS